MVAAPCDICARHFGSVLIGGGILLQATLHKVPFSYAEVLESLGTLVLQILKEVNQQQRPPRG